MSSPTHTRESLLAAVAALEQQRPLLGDAAVDAAQAGLQRLLAEAAPAAPALRQVSILFLDMVGSTTLGSRLDPEALHGVLDGLLQACTGAVRCHLGRVLQYTGDGLLAAFGADGAREDDAERAVRCGLDLIELGRQWSDTVRERHGHDGFGVRVGVHSGSVLLGAGVDREGSIRGLAVHVAARMEQGAPPGSLRISADTQALVRGLFELEATPPALLKGLQQPMASWLVRRALPRPAGTDLLGVEGHRAPLIGRDAEMQQLLQAWEAQVAMPAVRVLQVIAEAGIGKSRLLQAFGQAVGERSPGLRLLRARALPSSQSRPYALLAALLLDSLGLNDDADSTTLREAIAHRLIPLLGERWGQAAEAHAHALAHLAGLAVGDSPHLAALRDDAAQLRLRGQHAAWCWLASLLQGADGPWMLQLEDLHWADDATLRWLQQGLPHGAQGPLFIVATARPGLLERHPQGLGEGEGFTRLLLSPLAADQRQRLAQALLERLQPPSPTLQALLVERAEGNPFYMEELVRMLVDQGAIEVDAGSGRWRLHDKRLRADAVPMTLTGVLQARLDSLPASEREALQEASVLGAEFWDAALSALAPGSMALLPVLVQRALTRPLEQSPVPGWQAYAFGHALLHQVTYGTVLVQRRRELHALAARWLAAQLEQGAVDCSAQVADHYERAGEPLEAAHFWWRAARQAAERFDQGAVLDLSARGLGALSADTAPTRRLRWQLLMLRNGALVRLGRRDRALLEELSRLAEGLGALEQSLSWGQWADWHLGQADWKAMEAACALAEQLALAAGDVGARLQALRRRAGALSHLHRLDEARVLAEAGLTEAENAGQDGIALVLLNELALIVGLQHDTVLSLRLKQRAVEQAARQCNRYVQAVLLGNLGNAWRSLGQLEQARRDTESALAMLQGVGDRRGQVALLWILSTLAGWAGDAGPALAQAGQALQVARAIGDPSREVLALLGLAEALLLQEDRRSEARSTFEDCLQRSIALDDSSRFDAEAALAWMDRQDGNDAGALRRLRTLEDALQAGSSLEDTELHRLHWRCRQTAAGLDDALATRWLERARAGIEHTALGLAADVDLQRSFLERHPDVARLRRSWST